MDKAVRDGGRPAEEWQNRDWGRTGLGWWGAEVYLIFAQILGYSVIFLPHACS